MTRYTAPRGLRHPVQGVELPFVSFLRYLLSPVVVVGSLAGCLLLFGVPFEGPYRVLAVLAFLLALQWLTMVHLETGVNEALIAYIGSVFVRWTLIVGALAILGYVLKISATFSRRAMLLWVVVTPGLLLVSQLPFAILLRREQGAGKGALTAVVAGVGNASRRLVEEMDSDASLGVRFLGFFDDRSSERLGKLAYPLLGRLKDVAKYAQENVPKIVFIALPPHEPRLAALLNDLRDTPVSIYLLPPDDLVPEVIQARVCYFRGLPVLAIRESPLCGLNATIKRVSDVAIAALVLLAAAPWMALIAIAVKFGSPGPAIYRQRRFGLDGAEITVYKFRSMTVCDDRDEIIQARRKDCRVTPFGAFLRRTSLDELPQFVNVLQGRMSVVGPRPHALCHNDLYRQLVPGYMVRHKVKPGITGWAQIHGCRGETESVEKMRQRVAYDLEYVRNWSPSLDLVIVLRTVGLMFKDPAAY